MDMSLNNQQLWICHKSKGKQTTLTRICLQVRVEFKDQQIITCCYWRLNYKVHTISFQTFFVWALLLIVHTGNSSPLRSNLLRLQCTCCTIPTTSGRPHGSPLV